MYTNEIMIKASPGSNTRFNLMPFGDLQVGSKVFRLDMWERYVEDVRATRNVITVGMGDYTDHFRPTVQGRLRVALDEDSEKTVDQLHRDHIRREVLPLLKPVVANSACLGLLGGHHDMTYSDGTNSTQYLCQLLGVPYLGNGEALLRVNLKIHTSCLSFTLYATHGEGNGSSVGGNINKLQRLLGYMDADILLRGHSCDKFIFQEPWYSLTKEHPPKLRLRNRIVANCGSFSDGRAQGETTYVERKNLYPKAVGYVQIHLNVKRCGPGGNNKRLEIGD